VEKMQGVGERHQILPLLLMGEEERWYPQMGEEERWYPQMGEEAGRLTLVLIWGSS
jgi:hypothetical protein